MLPAIGSEVPRRPVIVLAAGRGRRMGGPKALMEVGGVPWWREQERRIAAAARGVPGLESCWVASPDVMSAWAEAPDRPGRVAMADPDAPMFASVAAGVRAVAAAGGCAPVEGVFVLPVDVPASTDVVVWRSLAKSGAVARPVWCGRHGHPLYLPWSWVEHELSPRLDDAGARLDQVIAGSVRDIAVDDETVVCNLNTPEDVQRFERVCSGP